MTPLILDLALARRIELAEAHAAVDCAEALERMRPGGVGAVEPIAGGFAIYCGAGSPVTQAVGLGLDGAVSEEEVDRLEEFYRSRNEAVRVETCPLADASLIRHFGERGYRVTEFSNVMALPLHGVSSPGADGPSPVAGLTMERIGKEQIDLWTLTVSQGFSENFPVTGDSGRHENVCAWRERGVLSGAGGRSGGGWRDPCVVPGRGRIVWGEHAAGISQSRSADSASEGAPEGRGGRELRLGRVHRSAGKQFAAQCVAAGLFGTVHAGEIRAALVLRALRNALVNEVDDVLRRCAG